MLKKLFLTSLKLLAKEAVRTAEDNFGAQKGLQKKKFAINFILARISLPKRIRALIESFLIELIGEAVEVAHSKLFKPKTS